MFFGEFQCLPVDVQELVVILVLSQEGVTTVTLLKDLHSSTSESVDTL